MRILRWPFVLAGAYGIVALLSYATHSGASPNRAPDVLSGTPTLRFASIKRGNIEQIVTVTGMVKPVETVEVGSQLSGQITKLYVDFNDIVRKGQPLAQIDPRTFQAKADQARAELDMALADVKLEQAKLDRAKIDAASARANKSVLAAKLVSAQALQSSAKKTLTRKMALQAHNVEAASTVEQAQTDLTSKTALEHEAEILVGLNAYSVKGADADLRRTEAELAQAEAAVPEKQAMLRQAEADLDRTIIRSPIDGVIVGRFVNEGQTLAVGLQSQATFSVAHRLQDMEIHARVDEADIGRIKPGQTAHFTVDAYPDRQFNAVVRQIRKAPQVSHNVVTYTVVLATSNPDGALLPGMTALVRIIVNKQEGVLKVPLAALRFRPSGAPKGRAAAPGAEGVWVRTAGGAVKRVPVSVGPAGAETVALESGNVAEGDQVAVGQAVRPAGDQWFGIKFGS